MSGIKRHDPEPQHEAFFQEFSALLRKHAGALSAAEMLAIASNAVGKIVALQDAERMSSREALEIVWKNVEEGNQQMIEEVERAGGLAAFLRLTR